MLKVDDSVICRLTDILTQRRSLERGGARTEEASMSPFPHGIMKERRIILKWPTVVIVGYNLNRLRCHVAALLNLNCQYCVQVYAFSWSVKCENEMARCLNHINYYFVCHCCR